MCRTLKARARGYARRPAALDLLHPGLSAAPPAALVAIAAHLVERERTTPRRWLGFGGEVGLLNARAALLLGRAERRRAALTRPTEPDAARQEPRRAEGVCRARSRGGVDTR